jgi:predicted protein tyrosine phosphatase
MQFFILGREEIGRFELSHKYIVISIKDPRSEDAELPESYNRVDVLRLAFHDWNEKQREYIEKEFPTSPTAQKMVYFNEDDAKAVVDFVLKHKDEVEVIVTQCEAGISRSAGMAAGICKGLGQDDSQIFLKYLPNSLVYKLVLNEFMKRR